MKQRGITLKMGLAAAEYLTDFVHAQLIALLMCLPFLVAWGLPLSIMSFAGNLIFSPFLSLFLFTSSLYFFTSLLNLPNSPLVWVMDTLAHAWVSLLTHSSKEWLIGFAQPHCFYIFAFPLVTLLLIHRLRSHDRIIRLIVLTCLAGANVVGLSIYSAAQQTEQASHIAVCNLELSIDSVGKIHAIEAGFFKRNMNIASAIDFKIMPELYKQYGSNHLESLTIAHPSGPSFAGAIALLQACSIRQIRIPYFEPLTHKQDWYYYFELKRVAQAAGTSIARYNDISPEKCTSSILRTSETTS